MSLSRNFCQKRVRANFRNFHTGSSKRYEFYFSVIVLHLALGLFIAKAYFGETDVKRKIGKSD